MAVNPTFRPATGNATGGTTNGGAAPTQGSTAAGTAGNAGAPNAQGPTGADGFGGATANLQSFEQGTAPLRAPEELASDLSRLSSAGELAGRFGADLVLARPMLLEHAALERMDRAQRLFEFAMPYARATLAMSGSPEELKAVIAQLLKQADAAGFREIVDQKSGKHGLAVLHALLKLHSPQEIEQHLAKLKFDAPSWPRDIPRPADTRAAAKSSGTSSEMARTDSSFVPATGRYAAPVDDPEEAAQSRRDRETNKRLGARMLWNVLHLFRADGEDGRDSAAQREAMNQLALIAGLLLVFLAIIVCVLATI